MASPYTLATTCKGLIGEGMMIPSDPSFTCFSNGFLTDLKVSSKSPTLMLLKLPLLKTRLKFVIREGGLS